MWGCSSWRSRVKDCGQGGARKQGKWGGGLIGGAFGGTGYLSVKIAARAASAVAVDLVYGAEPAADICALYVGLRPGHAVLAAPGPTCVRFGPRAIGLFVPVADPLVTAASNGIRGGRGHASLGCAVTMSAPTARLEVAAVLTAVAVVRAVGQEAAGTGSAKFISRKTLGIATESLSPFRRPDGPAGD